MPRNVFNFLSPFWAFFVYICNMFEGGYLKLLCK